MPSSNEGNGDVKRLLAPYIGPDRADRIWRCPSQKPFAGGRWTSSYGYNWQYLLQAGPDYPHSD